MNGFALDTNIVSAHLRGDIAVGERIRNNSRLYLPAHVLGELYYGAFHTVHQEAQLRRVRSFLPLVQIIHVEEDIAEIYGRLKAELASQGGMIPENHIWIAATALAHDLTLATRDAHFSRIASLLITRWE